MPKPNAFKTGMAENGKSQRFYASHIKEVERLLVLVVFKVSDKHKANGKRILCPRFVNSTRIKGTLDPLEKSQLTVQGSDDKPEVLTHSPILQRASQLLLSG